MWDIVLALKLNWTELKLNSILKHYTNLNPNLTSMGYPYMDYTEWVRNNNEPRNESSHKVHNHQSTKF